MQDKSGSNMTPKLFAEISSALKNVGSYGSVEIFVQDGRVTQITFRKIIKTHLNGSSSNGYKIVGRVD